MGLSYPFRTKQQMNQDMIVLSYPVFLSCAPNGL